MAIMVTPITSPRQREAFITFPWQVYRGDPLWVPPLLPERRAALDPRRGVFFQRGGEAQLFGAHRNGKLVGTICAADDRPTNAQRGLRDCMFGFFECLPDREAAYALLDAASAWGRARGLNALYGPFNLDYEDGYGVLVEGRDRPPVLLCGHTPPYYQEYIESYGFLPARGQNLAFALDPNAPELRRLEELALRARDSSRYPGTLIRPARFDRWEEEVDTVHQFMNTCLAHLPDFIPWQRESIAALLAPFRKIADPELILFAEVDGRTVGFLPGLFDVNEALIHANGLRYPWDYARLAWAMRRKPRCLSIKSILVLPEYWGSAAVMLLLGEMLARARRKGCQWIDLSLTSDDNPRTPILAERLGAKVYKRYQIYRKPI